MRTIESIGCVLAAAALAAATALAQPPASLTVNDRAAIQALVSAYARALGECRAEEFADLFVPETGYFASGFRGHIVGRERLIALVQSERHCVTPPGATAVARPGGANGPTVEVAIRDGVVLGVADLGSAEYQDEYAQTPQGWRFAARSVIIAAEKAAGLDAQGLLAIHRLGGAELGDHYEPDANGVPRLMTAGVAVRVADDVVGGRAYLAGGGYRDEVYERLGPGVWRVTSSTYVPLAD